MPNDERMQRYSDVIVEHSQFPRHQGEIDDATHSGHGENPFCGDRVTLQMRVNDEGVIEEAAALSVGCAISIASASLLVSHLQGLDLAGARALFGQVQSAIVEGLDDEQDAAMGELAALSFASRYPSRVKCATLPWHVLRHALDRDGSVATTE